MTARRVAVVVLSWNGADDTLACLQALRHSLGVELEIIIVDNGSTSSTLDRLRDVHDVLLVENGRNLGFAEGNNVGIRRALTTGSDAILILNNDTLVEPDAIAKLVSALDADPGAGAASPVMPFAATPERLWFAGAPYDPTRARSGRSSTYERGAALPATPISVDRVVGAAMLVRRAALEDVGGFEKELFFLHEDVDWSLRARASGWRLLLVPTARVAHEVSASQGGEPVTPTTAYYGTRNDLEMGRRHGHAHRWRRAGRQAGCFVVHVAQVRRAAPGTRLRTLSAVISGGRDFRQRRFGQWARQ